MFYNSGKGYRLKNMLTGSQLGMFKRGRNYVEFGQWKNNKLNGYGCAFWKKENVKIFGQFLNGFINGRGIQIENGKKQVHIWQNGRLTETISDQRIQQQAIQSIEITHLKYMTQWHYNQYNQILMLMGMNNYLKKLNCSNQEKQVYLGFLTHIQQKLIFKNSLKCHIPKIPQHYSKLFFFNLCPKVHLKNFCNMLIFDIQDGLSFYSQQIQNLFQIDLSLKQQTQIQKFNIQIESDGFFVMQLFKELNNFHKAENIDIIVIFNDQLKYLRDFEINHQQERINIFKGYQVVERMLHLIYNNKYIFSSIYILCISDQDIQIQQKKINEYNEGVKYILNKINIITLPQFFQQILQQFINSNLNNG